MKDDGDTKDDVKLPDNDLGARIERMFRDEEKDVSKCNLRLALKSDRLFLTTPPRRHHPDRYG